MPSYLVMDKISVWNYFRNVVLCAQGKKHRKKSKLRQLLGVFELHQSADKFTKPSEISATYQRLNPQSMKFAKLQAGCGHVGESRDYTWTWPGHFQHVLHVGPNFCGWHRQKNILQVGVGSVSTFYFLFLFNMDTGVSQHCLLKTAVWFVASFFSNLAFSCFWWWRDHFNIWMQSWSLWNFSV